jgi:1-phosphofructokinase family hexose kinase
MNLELIDSETGEVTEVLEPGPVILPQEADKFLDEFGRQTQDRPDVVISGSLPIGLPPDFYARMTTVAKQEGCRVLLDTSGEALSLALKARPDVIKPNRQEASALIGKQVRTQAEALTAARELRAAGIETVLLSLGDEGALALTANETLVAVPPKIKARSTVGSGDSFLAGWTVASAQGRPTADCLRMAIACGTANCLADSPALFTLNDVNEFLPQVQVFPG